MPGQRRATQWSLMVMVWVFRGGNVHYILIRKYPLNLAKQCPNNNDAPLLFGGPTTTQSNQPSPPPRAF